nr:SCO-spondin [Paramormyrops kingsleyae]
MEALILLVLGLRLVMAMETGHWCEHTVEEQVERIISPRQQHEVDCSTVFQFNLQGWKLDVDRMRHEFGGDDGIAQYYKKQGPRASCYMYKPEVLERQPVNHTVRGCCEGWVGSRCSQGMSPRGMCYSTWSCEDFPGVHNSSLMPLEQCCSSLWGLSWRNASDHTCLSCAYTLLPGFQSYPRLRGGALGGLWDTQGSGTCLAWGGAHYRTFDRKHFHFQGSCTYILASSIEGTWAVYISSVCDGQGRCDKALRMMLGLDLVSIHQRNVTLNGLLVPQNKALFRGGVSIHWMGDFVFVESGMGVRVKFDMGNTVHLTVTAEHLTATRGLCGIFNNKADDDFTTVSGTVTQYAASFGNSWRVPDEQSEGCSDAAELGHSCDIVGDADLRREAEAVCHRLLASPFTQCHQQVDPAPYADACLFLRCSLRGAERDEGSCDTLASYARECAQQHVSLSWRGARLCERKCPQGQVFSDCVSSCPPSCSSPLPPMSGQCKEECVSGCECPPGLYLHQGACLPREQCPCFHRRRTYRPGDAIRQRCNTCECSAGHWQCSSEKCAAQCTLLGALQVTTFDGKRYSVLTGDCGFTAVEDFVDHKLLVTVQAGPCASGAGQGCLREMAVTVLRTSVTVSDSGAVTVNGQRMALPVVMSDLTVRRASSSFIAVQTFGAQLLWHLEGPYALVTLQPGFAHKVRGLCGTLTWSQHDDFTTPEGDIESGVSSFASKMTLGGCMPPLGVSPDPCVTYPQKRQQAGSVCGIIQSGVFQPCHDVVERDPYIRLCHAKVCGCAPQSQCHCTVLVAYARHCAQEGVLVNWRNSTFCPVQCSGGQVYQECGRPCGGSCADLQQGWSCQGEAPSCVPGCQCPSELVQDDHGQCVPAALCPCVYGDRVYQPGSTIQNNCNTCVCERGVWNCTEEPCPALTACPPGLEYSPQSCLRTCSSLDAHPEPCPEPIQGCVCPADTVLLGDRCVPSSECPCHHNGRLYYSNDTITRDCNTCVCRGRHWHCGHALCAGTCLATGDPHYVTFDGRTFTFLGDCEYVLAREVGGHFSITAENMPCGSTGVTCTKSVTFTVGGIAVHLLRGKAVSVNGMPVALPKAYSGSGLHLEQIGLFVSLSSRFGITVLWDGGMRVYIRLSPKFRGRVAGLCGNFDGDAENDFTTRQGIIESTAELFGNSWKVNPTCPDVQSQDLRDPCTENPHRVPWARRRCAVITQELFAPCHAEVAFQLFYDWCVFDACGCDSGGDCECLCTAVAAYAEECNRRGIYIHWRSQELCPLQCENGLVYKSCGPACKLMCPSSIHNPDSPCSALSCVEGCFCESGTVWHGDGCITPLSCPCEWEGSLFPPGSYMDQDCQNCSCQAGSWHCEGSSCIPESPCLESEFQCVGGRCIPAQWRCDNEDDCGDGSDELCPSTCAPGQLHCSSGRCLDRALWCDGHPDCADQSDEEFCAPVQPVPLCPPGEFQCSSGLCLPTSKLCDGRSDCGFADDSDEQDCGATCGAGEFRCVGGRCLAYIHRCDGHDDCGDLSDERGCVCAAGELQCPGDQCVPTERVCDGVPDCPSGTDEAVCPPGGCGHHEFRCIDGHCVPLAWRCDGETDCPGGEDEQTCQGPCGPGQFPCRAGGQCIEHQQLCDGSPHCRDGSDESEDNCDQRTTSPPVSRNTSKSCPEYTCLDGTCIIFKEVCNGIPECPESTTGLEGGPSDERGCRTWGPWGPWSPCSRSCGSGSQIRQRQCPLGDPLRHCRGEDTQKQSCFSVSCPVDGEWLPWVTWSNCTKGCGGVEVRHRGCVPPQNGGKACTELPGQPTIAMEIKPCPQDKCSNVSCPEGLVRWKCAPCPLTCAHLSNEGSCESQPPGCLSGCWCPEGQVMSHTQQCVRPEECICEVSGVRYWPGQQVKVGCDICTCAKGRPQHCKPNPECSVHCGWSAWSPWGECLGPCGVQSVQWSFRSPNNPSKHGNGRHCRGIYRKARRCQTGPCRECEFQGRSHAVQDQWKLGQCQLCQCLPNLTVQCAPYCPHDAGCPQGQTLIPRDGERCCYCKETGSNGTVTSPPKTVTLPVDTVSSMPPEGPPALVPTYPLPTGEECWAPLGVQDLPVSSFSASSHQDSWPPWAGRLDVRNPRSDLQGWSPEPEKYRALPRWTPEGGYSDRGDGGVKPLYLQLDLLKPRNITGIITQGGGAFDAYVSSFYLQFSNDGQQWFTYQELITDARARAKVFLGNRDDSSKARVQLDRMVSSRFVRVLPHDFQNGIYLRVELLGCATEFQPPLTSPSPRPCPDGQFSCPTLGPCVGVAQLCNGVPDCPDAADEWGCFPQDKMTTPGPGVERPLSNGSDTYITSTPSSLRTPQMASVTLPTPGIEGPTYRGPCSSPLGMEDGRIRYGQLTSSTHWEDNPADAGRLNVVPNVLIMEPGWSPRPDDPQPYLQVDFLEPAWVSGVVTQGSELGTGGYLSKYRLAFSLDGSHFTDYKENTEKGPQIKVFEVRMVGRRPVTRWLTQLIQARYLRIIPVEFRHTFYLRAEILGCRDLELVTPGGGAVIKGLCTGGEFPCGSGGCVPLAALCDGRPDCRDRSDELNCGTTGAPGVWNRSSPTGGPDLGRISTPPPAESLSPPSGTPGPPAPPSDEGLPRVLCTEGQFACRAFGCVDAALICDGRDNCPDGSDEDQCGGPSPTPGLVVTTGRPLVPSPCSPKQFSCGSGECIHLDRRCDLRVDCLDGSDERSCVDCILSPWTQWSQCSASCGLGSLFRQREILRQARPGGECGGALFDSRACFNRACPVDGQWAEWSSWSQCNAPCGGGLRTRNRSCSDPPPKNGGRDCQGLTVQTHSCNGQPCGSNVDLQTGCSSGMVLVTEGDCRAGRATGCLRTCLELSSPSDCPSQCIPGCRCPAGQYAQDGRCVKASQCLCHWDGRVLQPGENVLKGNCSTCLCQDGQVFCSSSPCEAGCYWSAWSTWAPCDSAPCGVGVQQRYRSPLIPSNGTESPSCPGDTSDARQCFVPCPPGDQQHWGEWTAWSQCSKTCFLHVDDVGLRRRFRSCNGTDGGSCDGDTEEQEPCNTVLCPVAGAWSPWSPWSSCSSECDSGSQTRQRLCDSPPPQYGGDGCPGPQIQTRDCNTQPCSGACPEGMSYLSVDQCRAQGGACPRVCLDLTPSAACATDCYDGCYCAPSLYLLNGSCVPLSACPCYHQGALYSPGASMSLDACNNCTCINGEMDCGTAPCPVHCGWSAWTPWSACSRTCDVGVRRRYRSPSSPAPGFGGRPCKGGRVEMDTCSLEPCQGARQPWGAWSECSVPCGGGYRNRTRGPSRTHGMMQQFSACNVHPCGNESGCPGEQELVACVRHPASCSDLSTEFDNSSCTSGCQCRSGLLLQDGNCVSAPQCRCYVDSEQFEPGDTITQGCRNCTCESGVLTNCTDLDCDVDGLWSAWTPWSDCSTPCGPGLQSRYRFCSSPPRSGRGLPCLGPDRQDQLCVQATCDRDGGWGEWTPWTECTKSCGGGMQSRQRECDSPTPEGKGDFCEGPGSEIQSCNTDHCPVAPCTEVPGTAFSSCGPSCPRSCDDLANGTSCIQTEDCPCLDMATGQRLVPGETVPAPDGCNNCTCEGGRITCTRKPCPVAGGWCEWSGWTPCSRTCGTEWVSRYRSCGCPEPKAGGPACPGEQEAHGGMGVQIQRQPCPSVTFCPVNGFWGSWSPWTQCDVCAGVSTRSRICSSPPARFGGLPCPGETRQSRGCHDNGTICSDCPGGQEEWPCGKPCPRSCSDLHGDTECVDVQGCQPSCGCPDELLLQDGLCVRRDECRCKFPNSTTGGVDSANASWAWPGISSWHFMDSGETITSACKNCTCEDGVVKCQSLPGCHVDGAWSQWGAWTQCSAPCGGGVKLRFRQCDNPTPQNGGRGCAGVAEQRKDCNSQLCTDSGPGFDWSPWTACSVSCGGGEQSRSRTCRSPPCEGVRRQSKTCNTQVCLEVGCPPGRLYRECEWGEGCPFSCAQVSGREGCYSDGCDEGCHCPPRMFLHRGSCVQECPCEVNLQLLSLLRNVSVTPAASPAPRDSEGQNLTLGTELQPGVALAHECSACQCQHGQWNCSLIPCPRDGGPSPWGAWGPCSLSCGGLGQKSRTRTCSNPAPAHGGKDCEGPLQEHAYCQTPDCPVILTPTVKPSAPDENAGFSPWSLWSACSRSCSDARTPAWKSRRRECVRPPCSGEQSQEIACNLPQCPDGGPCWDENCVRRNCSWTEWADWAPCSRSCGVGQQQRIRTYLAPGGNGSWCEDILGGHMESRFCNIRACRVDGSWSRWSPWSRCDSLCGGGRSIRTRSCTSPPPKNGGRSCKGDRNQVKPCNTKPCDDQGCPPGQEFAPCANVCPQRCSDLQQGIRCQEDGGCQPGCRCPAGRLQQDGACVHAWQCDCTDSQGHSWAAGSWHQDDCNNCSCADGLLSCTNWSCSEAPCSWSAWSAWASCSASCGSGHRTRFRSMVPEPDGADCQFEEVQRKPCDLGPCPPLCIHDDQELIVGDTWLQGECKQCTCTPEGDYCQDVECQVDGGWTPWSVWSDCPVTCGRGTRIRTRACINPPPRNNGMFCPGDERETQDCHAPPCLDDFCPWSRWSSCSRTCGAGVMSRHRRCVCAEGGDAPCPAELEGAQEEEETRLCYKQPCPDCPMSEWSEWTACSCQSQREQRYRAPLSAAIRGQQCPELQTESRTCQPQHCLECKEPFQYADCGSPCEKLCALQGHNGTCAGPPACTPGCYCPQGLLQQNGTCVPPGQCGCTVLLHQLHGRPVSITIQQGETVTVGCSTCLCQDEGLHCDSRECEVSLSEWSEWTPCSPCVLPPTTHATMALLDAVRPLSFQRRYRACLDLDSGLPISKEEEGSCGAELEEERPCPDPAVCLDVCQWSVWGPWRACQEPCSGGFRQRHRTRQDIPVGPQCRGQQSQTESCNTGLCPGERCEDRGRIYEESCANQCPRSCTDLWEHVQCLQGACQPGCRCPDSWLTQDGQCVPESECRCGIPMENGTLEILPGEVVMIDCNNCTCENGSLACSDLPCPVYGSWGPWGSCSSSCGFGYQNRSRTCRHTAGGPPCEEMNQTQLCLLPSCPVGCVLSDWSSWSTCSASCGGGVSVRNKTVLQEPQPGGEDCSSPLEQHTACNTQSCLPECTGGQVFSACAGVCPYTCEDLWPETQCVPGPCQPGCTCPPGKVLLEGSCVPHKECPCSSFSLHGPLNLSSEEQKQELPPGMVLQHLCNTCVCQGGVFNCTEDTCDVDCEWDTWSEWGPCSATCDLGVQSSERAELRARQYGGAECQGPSVRSRPCSGPDCACPPGERWRRSGPGAPSHCERSCAEIYEATPPSCGGPGVGVGGGCVCQEGLYRGSGGECVIAALCECQEAGTFREAGSEWAEGCQSCRCVNGQKQCHSACPPLHCEEGKVKILEPGSCCPVCRMEFPGELEAQCRRVTEVRNITKGNCRLDNVEVSYCRGRCLSGTDVILEEPYLQASCDCCSYRLDPRSPVRFLSLQCDSGETEPVVLPVIHSCECTSCQGGDLSRR